MQVLSRVLYLNESLKDATDAGRFFNILKDQGVQAEDHFPEVPHPLQPPGQPSLALYRVSRAASASAGTSLWPGAGAPSSRPSYTPTTPSRFTSPLSAGFIGPTCSVSRLSRTTERAVNQPDTKFHFGESHSGVRFGYVQLIPQNTGPRRGHVR